MADINTYVIEMVGHSVVKIGKTSNLVSRFSSLQCASPYQLRTLAWLKGDVEKTLHTWLNTEHVRGEWYRLTWRTHAALDKFERLQIADGI